MAHKKSRPERRTHKGHEIYTGLGHRCGVIPYSSVWCGGLPLGLMKMSNTRKNSLARSVLGWGDELLGGVQSPFSLSLCFLCWLLDSLSINLSLQILISLP